MLANSKNKLIVLASHHPLASFEDTTLADKIEALLRVLEPYGIREIVQSGTVSLARGPRGIGTTKS